MRFAKSELIGNTIFNSFQAENNKEEKKCQ